MRTVDSNYCIVTNARKSVSRAGRRVTVFASASWCTCVVINSCDVNSFEIIRNGLLRTNEEVRGEEEGDREQSDFCIVIDYFSKLDRLQREDRFAVSFLPGGFFFRFASWASFYLRGSLARLRLIRISL